MLKNIRFYRVTPPIVPFPHLGENVLLKPTKINDMMELWYMEFGGGEERPGRGGITPVTQNFILIEEKTFTIPYPPWKCPGTPPGKWNPMYVYK